MNTQLFLVLLVSFSIAVAGFAALWSAMRRHRRTLGLEQERPERTQDVTFIINAFHDANRRLKEKEQELERLRSLAEQRAETVETMTENILECVASGVVTFDNEAMVTTVNRAAEELLGGRPIGDPCSGVFGDSEITASVLGTLERRGTTRRSEASYERAGERRWLGYTTALLTDRQGSTRGAILSFTDLTEVKRLQERMELKERLSALGEMSAGIAHELRNPMAVIAGYLNILAKGRDEGSQAIIRDISAEINGMNRIIGDLLTFARPAPLHRTQVDLRALIDECLDAALPAERRRSITVTADLDPVMVLADEGLLRQAFGNIVQNAVDAMPGGGALTMTARAGREPAVTIADTGEGISAERLGRIFLPFFTTKEHGVGMGLALAHKIITSHGGRIDVESHVGRGTVFTVMLPKD